MTLLSTITCLILSSSLVNARNAPVRRTLADSPTDLPGTWTFQGCSSDDPSSRTLIDAVSVAPSDMTVENCISFCSGDLDVQPNTYIYAGVEYSQECYCGNALATSAVTLDNSSCDMACSGDADETCGGAGAMSLYFSGGAVDVPTVVDRSGLWQSAGCYSDSVSGRTLANFYSLDGLTVETCTATCEANGFDLAGVEYSTECYCGNTFDNDGSQIDDSSCNMACGGDKSELCGGAGAMNMYVYNGTVTTPTGSSTTTSSTTTTTTATTTSTSAPAAQTTGPTDVQYWDSLGCYTDDTSARTLNNRVSVDGDVTTESCIAACYAADYKFAGTEYSDECYCDNALQNGAGPSGDDLCNMPCAGDSTEMCGGAARINIYEYTGPYVGPIVVPSVGAWISMGCMNDSVTDRALPDLIMDDSTVTAETCTAACEAAGFTIAGLEYYHECYCASQFAWGPVAMPAADCNMICDGNKTEYCGGQDRLNVYTLNPTTTSTTSTTTTTTSTTSTTDSTTTTTPTTDSTTTTTSTSTSTTTTISTTTSPTTSMTTNTTTSHTSTPCTTKPYSFSWPFPFSFSFPSHFPTTSHRTTTSTTSHPTSSTPTGRTTSTPCKTSTSTTPTRTSTTSSHPTTTSTSKPCTTSTKPTTTSTSKPCTTPTKAATTTARTTSTAHTTSTSSSHSSPTTTSKTCSPLPFCLLFDW